MKKYAVTINGQVYDVEIDDPYASPASVRVNGQSFSVTLQEQGTSPKPASRSREEIEETWVPAVTATFVEAPAIEDQSESPAPPEAVEGSSQITAPMPGKVMDITAQVGDTVENGDVLCNLEAMKMKSPIRSTTEGTVAEVLVSEGQNVNYGDVLFTLS